MKVSILGLGWIGEPLGHLLVENSCQVIGSTTKPEKRSILQGKGIDARLLSLNPEPSGEDFEELFTADVLYINIPPARRTKSDDFHIDQLGYLLEMVAKGNVERAIYVSSTSVYPDLNREVDEGLLLTTENTGNPVLHKAEKIMQSFFGDRLTIIRFGGLLGDNRVPGRYFSGRSDVVGHAPANYVYRSDAVRSVHWIIRNDLWGEVYNITAPLHPAKREVYEANAKQLGFAPPVSYGNESATWKLVSSAKFLATGFVFDYPDPCTFPYKL
jgi:nucleoside-diphosphate-sugar epimerase